MLSTEVLALVQAYLQNASLMHLLVKLLLVEPRFINNAFGIAANNNKTHQQQGVH